MGANFNLVQRASVYKKLEVILSASKLKVVNSMAKIKLEANHYYTMSLFAKNIFEKAFDTYGFASEVYRNNFRATKEINIVFLEKRHTLSPSRDKVLQKFKASYRVENLNMVVTDEIDVPELKGFDYLRIATSDIVSMSYEIMHRYISKQFRRVNVISSLDNPNHTSTILPMSELRQSGEYKYDALLKGNVAFYPSLDVVIEQAFLDYVKFLIKYFFIYGQYVSLKATLLKHENSLDALERKNEALRKEMAKLRQENITSEILIISEAQNG